MKLLMRMFLVLLALTGMGISLSFPQSLPKVGDFGSIKSGNWSDSTTWKRWDGTGWNTAPSSQLPIGSSSSVYVLTGDTVTFDNALSGSSNCKNLYVQSGALLRSDVVLPTITYLKINGDTVWVDGNMGKDATDGFSFEIRNNTDSSVTILGSTGTVNLGQIRPNSSQSTALTLTFARNATINYAGGSGTGGAGLYTSRGTQSSTTVTINAGSTLTFGSNSHFELNSSSTSNGTMNTTINVNGTVNLPSSKLLLANGSTKTTAFNVGSAGVVNVGNNFIPYLTGGSLPTVTIASGGAFNILSGGTADFSNPSAAVTGAGTFALKSGASVTIGANSGLDASSGPIRTTTATLEPGVNYLYVATAGQSLGARLPSQVNNLTIDTTAVDTLSTSVSVNGHLNVNGSLVVNAGALTIDTANVYGTLKVIGAGIADFTYPASVITGTGSFTVNNGGTINIGASAGLDASAGPVRTANFTIDTTSSFGYTGTGYQQFGAMLPDSVANLSIGSKSIDTVSATRTVLGVLKVDGLLVNSDSLVTVDTVNIINGTYQLNTTKQGLPRATWNTGSTCLVTAPVTTATGGIPNGNQNFYNYEVNSPNHTGAGRLGFNGNTIYGDLIIHNTNDPTTAVSNYVALFTKTGTTPVNLMGNLLVDSVAGSVSIGTGSGVAIQTLFVHGNVVSKGSVYLNGSGVTNKLFIYGNLTATNTSSNALRGHSAVAYADTIFFCGTTPQKFIKAVGLTNLTNLSFRVMSGSTLSLSDTTVVNLGGIGTFTVDSGATLKLANKNGANGNITGLAPTLSTKGNYEFNGDTAQVTGTWFPTKVNNLVINDSLGVTLSSGDTLGALTVTGGLTLLNGRFITTDTTYVVIPATGAVARSTGYVDGRLQKLFAAAGSRDFEVGTANGYSPVNVKVNAGTGAMTVKAVQGEHPNTFDATKTLARYWTLTAAGITNADLKFSYLASDVKGTESKYGAWRYSGTGTTWTALTSTNLVSQHSVTTLGVTSFSDWTLGESSMSTEVQSSDDGGIPKVFFVDQNYPNPFNPTTTISYGLPQAGYVTAKVYNLVGQEVATVVAGQQSAGVHRLSFDGTRLSSGVYFYRIQAGTSVMVKRMILLK